MNRLKEISLYVPYPFNTSESSRIECFSNDQGIILSLTIIATSKDDITKNGSVILTILESFNYSNYHHGEQKISYLEVLSVVGIPQKELYSINTYNKTNGNH